MKALLILGLAVLATVRADGCADATDEDVEELAKVIFAYSQGAGPKALAGIAHTVLNRVKSPHFPNTTLEVINQEKLKRNCKEIPFFIHITKPNFGKKWQKAAKGKKRAPALAQSVKAAEDALCGRSNDPTNGALTFTKLIKPKFIKAPMKFNAIYTGYEVCGMKFYSLEPKIKQARPPQGNDGGGRRQGGGGRRRGGRRGGPQRGNKRRAKRSCDVPEDDVKALAQVAFAYGVACNASMPGIVHTVINRVAHPMFANTTLDVIAETKTKGNGKKLQFFKALAKPNLKKRLRKAEKGRKRVDVLAAATLAAEDALCGTSQDPTNGALTFAQIRQKFIKAPWPVKTSITTRVELGGIQFYGLDKPDTTGMMDPPQCGSDGKPVGGRRGGGGGRRRGGGGRGRGKPGKKPARANRRKARKQARKERRRNRKQGN